MFLSKLGHMREKCKENNILPFQVKYFISLPILFTFILYFHCGLFIALLSRIIYHHNEATVLTILLTMPVCTATPERSFNTLCRVKTCTCSTRTTEQLSSLLIMHAYRDTPIGTECRPEFVPRNFLATAT